MADNWLKWTPSRLRVIGKPAEREVPKLTKPPTEDGFGTFGTLAPWGEQSYYAKSDLPMCPACGSYFIYRLSSGPPECQTCGSLEPPIVPPGISSGRENAREATDKTDKIPGLPCPGYHGGQPFACEKCGTRFDTSAGHARHQVYGCDERTLCARCN